MAKPSALNIIRSIALMKPAFASGRFLKEEIIDLVNEETRNLEEGYALRAVDRDIIFSTATGFPHIARAYAVPGHP